MVRCRRIHRLSVWGVGTAWAMAGGAALGTSAKSGIWGGVDASTMAEDVPSAAIERQRAIVLERRKEKPRLLSPADDCGIGVVSSMQFSLGSNGAWQSQRAKVMPFLWAVSTMEMIRIPVRYQIVLRLTPNGLQVAGKETSR
jgi:hypothetical protein